MKKFVRDHFEDFVNKRNASVIRKNMTSDFHDHDGPGGKPTGVDGDEQMMLNMYKAMPDLHLSIEDMIAEGDKVVCRNIWRWTDTASGKKMQFHGLCFGGSRAIKSQNGGLRLLLQQRESRGLSQPRNRLRNEQVDLEKLLLIANATMRIAR
jgi:predicted ester cyclase